MSDPVSIRKFWPDEGSKINKRLVLPRLEDSSVAHESGAVSFLKLAAWCAAERSFLELVVVAANSVGEGPHAAGTTVAARVPLGWRLAQGSWLVLALH